MKVRTPVFSGACAFVLFALLHTAFGDEFFSFRLPEKTGVVKEAFRGASDKTVILIENPYGNPDGQRQIERILGLYLESGLLRDRPVWVFAEGGTGVVEPATANRLLADTFLQRGSLSGAESAFLFSGGRISLFGVETPPLYDKYREAGRQLGLIFPLPEFLVSRLAAAEQKLFSAEMRDWLREKESREKEETGLVPYCRSLARRLSRHGLQPQEAYHFERLIQAAAMEESLEYAQVDAERRFLVARLEKTLRKPELSRLLLLSRRLREEKIPALDYYAALDEKIPAAERKNYPNLVAYIEIVRRHAEIQKQTLVKELAALEEALAKKLAPSASEKALWGAREDLRELAALGELRAGREAWDLGDPAETLRRLEELSGLPYTTRETGELEAWKERLQAARDCYAAAVEREQPWGALLLTQLEKSGARAAFFAAGPFHTPFLAETLRRGNVSYLLVAPRAAEKKNPFSPPLLLRNELPEFPQLAQERDFFAAAALALDLLEDRRIVAAESETAARLNDFMIEKRGIARGLVPLPEYLWRDEAAGTLTVAFETPSARRFSVLAGKLFVNLKETPAAPPSAVTAKTAASLDILRVLVAELDPSEAAALAENLRRKSARPGLPRLNAPISNAADARAFAAAIPESPVPFLTQGKAKETSFTVRQLKEKEARRIAPLLGEDYSKMRVTEQLDFMDTVCGASFQKLLNRLGSGEAGILYLDAALLTQEKGKWVRRLLESPAASSSPVRIVLASHRPEDDFDAVQARLAPGWKTLLSSPAVAGRLTIADARETAPALFGGNTASFLNWLGEKGGLPPSPKNLILLLDEKTLAEAGAALDPLFDGFPVAGSRGVLRLPPSARRALREAGADPYAFAGGTHELKLLLEEVQLRQLR